MDPVKEIDILKSKKIDYERKIAVMSDNVSMLSKQIVETKSKIMSIDQAIFQHENVVYLAAARMAASENPKFEELLKSCAEKIIFESTAKKPKGRPKKDAS